MEWKRKSFTFPTRSLQIKVKIFGSSERLKRVKSKVSAVVSIFNYSSQICFAEFFHLWNCTMLAMFTFKALWANSCRIFQLSFQHKIEKFNTKKKWFSHVNCGSKNIKRLISLFICSRSGTWISTPFKEYSEGVPEWKIEKHFKGQSTGRI